MMYYVRALTEADWVEVPIKIARPAEHDPHAPELPKLVRTLVMALEDGCWKINDPHEGVNVSPGLVVSFNDSNDAAFFLGQPDLASRVHVEPGQVVAFLNDEDAEHFIAIGVAERATRQDGRKALAAKDPSRAPTRVVAMRATG